MLQGLRVSGVIWTVQSHAEIVEMTFVVSHFSDKPLDVIVISCLHPFTQLPFFTYYLWSQVANLSSKCRWPK